MKFSIKEWSKYKKQVDTLSDHLKSYKKDFGDDNFDSELLKAHTQNIKKILKRCSNYLDKCGMTMPEPLWIYDHEDKTTHPSSKKFIYEHLMSEEQIKAYGIEFMSN